MYSRNPDGDDQPWCFVNKNKKLKWNYCKVRKCSGGKTHTHTHKLILASTSLICSVLISRSCQLQPPHKQFQLQPSQRSPPPSSPSVGSRSLAAQPGSSGGRSLFPELIRGRSPCRPDPKAPPGPSATSVEASSLSPAGCSLPHTACKYMFYRLFDVCKLTSPLFNPLAGFVRTEKTGQKCRWCWEEWT